MNQLQMINRMLWGGVPSYPPFLDTDTSLWLKADNPLNTNTRWYDASPNNHVLTGTATLTDNVLNGQKGYVFNGTSNYFDGGDILDIGTNSRVMIVITQINGSNGAVFGKTSTSGVSGRWSNFRYLNNFYTFINAQISYPDTETSFKKIETIYDSVSTMFYTYLNNSFKYNTFSEMADFQTTFNFLIGAYNNTSGTVPPNPAIFLNGTICEIIFFDRLLSTAETTEVNAYLNTKYGL